jgi:hypothetical protein
VFSDFVFSFPDQEKKNFLSYMDVPMTPMAPHGWPSRRRGCGAVPHGRGKLDAKTG